MKPIPQTVEVLSEISRTTGETDLPRRLQEMADDVESLVPDCVGLSITWVDNGVTFTLVASDQQVTVLDALQYLSEGPCTTAVHREHGIVTDSEAIFAEDDWRLFAQGTAAHGVRSSITFPLVREGRTVGSANLYGATDRAFDGLHDALAEILQAWAPGAVSNADLSFSSRRRAEEAPERLRNQALVDQATGVLAAHFGIDVDDALHRLRDAAARAGVDLQTLAQAVLALHQ